MSGPRVLLMTRRFWPLVGESENATADLATGLLRLGARPTVLTGRWQTDWSPRVCFAGVPIVRVDHAARTGLGQWRYLVNLRRWLRSHQDQIDVICVTHLRYDAYAAIGAACHPRIPVVLRADQAGAAGDCAWLKRSRLGSRLRKRMKDADVVVAANQSVCDELLAAGFAESSIKIIHPAVRPVRPANATRMFSARIALAEANGDLVVTFDNPVVLYVGRMQQANGLDRLVRAWRGVVAKIPNARLWLAGDGPQRDELHQLIRDLDLKRCVFMPGSFDDIEELLQAANVIVDPTISDSPTSALFQAIGTGTPIIAVACDSLRAVVDSIGGNSTLLVRSDISCLRDALIEALSSHESNRPIDKQSQLSFLRTNSPKRIAAEYLALFEQLIESKA